MALYIRFGNNKQPELVADIQKLRVVRVVRTPNRIEVMPLHRQDISTHVFNRHGFATIRIMVMSVYTLNHYPLAVYEQITIDNRDISEANALFNRINHGVVGVAQLDSHDVTIWYFC